MVAILRSESRVPGSWWWSPFCGVRAVYLVVDDGRHFAESRVPGSWWWSPSCASCFVSWRRGAVARRRSTGSTFPLFLVIVSSLKLYFNPDTVVHKLLFLVQNVLYILLKCVLHLSKTYIWLSNFWARLFERWCGEPTWITVWVNVIGNKHLNVTFCPVFLLQKLLV